MDKHDYLYGDNNPEKPKDASPAALEAQRLARIESERIGALRDNRIKGESDIDYNRHEGVNSSWARDKRDQTPLALYCAQLKRLIKGK